MKYDSVTINPLPVEQQKDDPVRTSRKDLWFSALLLGLIVGSMILVVGEAIVIGYRAWDWAGWVALDSLVAGVLVAGATGIRWIWKYAEHKWQREDKHYALLREQHRLENLQLENKIMETIGEPADPDAYRYDKVAYDILQRHYRGESISRDACVAAEMCTQAEWNVVNEALQIVGWKQNYKLVDMPRRFEHAWALWGKRTQVWDDGSMWALDRNNNHRKIAAVSPTPSRNPPVIA